MEAKKNPKADLEKMKGLFMQIGLVSTLALVLLAFEWKTYEDKSTNQFALKADDEQEEIIPITKPPDLPPPPPPPAAPVIQVVKDEIKVEDTQLEDTETDQETEVVAPIETPKEEVAEPEIFTIVEDNPAFPGCEGLDEQKKSACIYEKISLFIAKNVQYPAVAKENGIQGKVYIQFVVDATGKVKSPKILRSSGNSELDNEALRLVNKMPVWTPGKQRGKSVPVYFTQPFNFSLK